MQDKGKSDSSTAANQELLKKLQTAIEIETDVETQKRIIEDYAVSRNAIKPQFKPESEPDYPQLVVESGWTKPDRQRVIACGGAVLFGLIGMAENPAIGLTLMAVFGVLTIIAIVLPMGRTSDNKRANQERLDNYHSTVQRVHMNNEKKKAQYMADLQVWEATNNKMYSLFQEKLSASMDVLARFYTLDFIFAKYRNLPALTSIYEYYITGRCTALDGPTGAYNLYETELRMDTVISQLNTVIENLESIRQNQYMLYQQVSAMKNTLGMIHQEISAIKDYTIDIAQLTALNTYYNRITARNAQLMTLFHLL